VSGEDGVQEAHPDEHADGQGGEGEKIVFLSMKCSLGFLKHILFKEN